MYFEAKRTLCRPFFGRFSKLCGRGPTRSARAMELPLRGGGMFRSRRTEPKAPVDSASSARGE